MGEAKRRKQLGLMPVVHDYVANVAEDGQVTLISGPQDPALREQLLQGLSEVVGQGQDWQHVYRRGYVVAGLPQKLLRTAADVQAIAVPKFRRLVGELLLNYDIKAVTKNLLSATSYHPLGERVGGRGTWLHHRTEYSDDGRQWSSLPKPDSPRDAMQYLTQHPVTQEKAEVVATYQTEQSVDGALSITPEPPAGVRAELEAFVREWNGATPEQWREIFAEMQGLEEGEAVPQRIRMAWEFRQPHPLPGLFHFAATTIDGLDVHPVMNERYYSLDGETWRPYDEPRPFDEEEEFDYVLAHADGSVEWDEAEFNAEQRQAVLQVLGELFGVGDPDAWQVKLPQHLADIYDDDLVVPEGQRLPAPQSIGFSVEPEFWTTRDDRREHVELIEFTYGDDDWFRFYDPELPAQLQPYANPDK